MVVGEQIRAYSISRWVLRLLVVGLAAGCGKGSGDDDTNAACPTGYTDCGGQCLDLASSALNCGTCGAVCGSGQTCTAGACQCQAGLSNCSGQCVNLQGDGANCGTCGTTCPGSQVCAAGACSAGGCPTGQLRCGASCVDSATNPLNCGVCGRACASPMTCSGGTCACPAGTTDCGGQCVDTTRDLNHCGGCGTPCSGGAACSNGTCVGGSGGSGGAPSGGATGSGGAGTGGVATGGAGMGGAQTGGAQTGGAQTGGTQTGGTETGGAQTGGTETGGTETGGAETGGTETGGASTGGAVSTGPCDIYAAADTPCVAAYSMVRRLSSSYSGPLYQVRRGGTAVTDGTGTNQKTGVRSGGTVQDIGQAGGFGDAAAQDAFCGSETCTVSILYDQSGSGNDLRVAPAGCYDDGSSNLPDFESDAKGRSLTVGGHRVYALYTDTREGYRNNEGTIPTGTEPQGIYMVADGKRYGGACCWDFGNASKDNCYGTTGIMDALFFGTGYWGRGAGNGPWFMADFEAGVWAGGSGESSATNNNLPSSTMDYAFGILKTTSTNYALRVGDAQSGGLTTAYDGPDPKNGLRLNGGIILGIGGDNSNHSYGTFFEGVITAGRPDDATDDAVLDNVQAAGYGQ